MLLFFSSGKAWVFHYITCMIFPQIFGVVTVQQNQLGLTDEDPSEYRTFEANTEVDDNYRCSKVMLCTFHAIWKPFKQNVHSRLPKDCCGLLLSTTGRNFGMLWWYVFWKTNASCTTKENFVWPWGTYLIVQICMTYSTVWSFICYHIKVQPSFFGSCWCALNMNLNTSMTNHNPLWKSFATVLKQITPFNRMHHCHH